MPLGPGKYGANAEKLLKEHGGELCVVILIGQDGPGFDVATTNPTMMTTLPGILRLVADDIEETLFTPPTDAEIDAFLAAFNYAPSESLRELARERFRSGKWRMKA